MLEDIKNLIDAKKFDEALELIVTQISDITDIQKYEEEYSELLHLRVLAKYQIQQKDVIIRDQIKREKFPSETFHQVGDGYRIRLIHKAPFLEKTDAYVNTISINEPFSNVNPQSSTSEFIDRIKDAKLKEQLKKQSYKKAGQFILLEHKDMSAPISYHIKFYDGDKADFELLEQGIKNVLDDASEKKLKSLSFFALAFDLVIAAEQSQKSLLAEKIADKTAEIIVGYILEKQKKKFIPRISFNFVIVSTMFTFQKAFSKWADFQKPYFNIIKQIKEKQRRIIESALTRDESYIEKLNEITFSLDDRESVLILGETGVGKSYLSSVLHKNSNRSHKPFLEKNCQQITRELIYPILFGAVKGSYTGAHQDQKGAIEAAEGGILFLDEIAYADLEVQRSLLKFLDKGEYSRLGEETITKKTDVKVVFGTNVDLLKSVGEKTFAHDLFERIDKNVLNIPPLRNRRDDIPLLIDYFKKKLNDSSSFKIEILKATIDLLKTYNWPGNIRQLSHYLGDLFRKARSKNILIISPEIINENQPRNDLWIKNPLRELEELLLELLKKWDTSQGDILEEVVKPILAKIYLQDFGGNKKQSSSYIGLDGTRGTKSLVDDYLGEYEKIKEINLK